MKNNGVRFITVASVVASVGNVSFHSYDDFHLILAPFTPTPAEPQTNFLEVPGRDGYLDLTEANGDVKFKSREFKFVFTVAPGDTLTFDERVSVVSNALNGKMCKITLDRDPDYYWEGRCSVSEYSQDKNIGQIVVTATVNPYKLKQDPTVVSVTVTSDIELKWDGDTTGLIYAVGMDWWGWRISSTTPTAADFNAGGIIYYTRPDGEELTFPFTNLEDIPGEEKENGVIWFSPASSPYTIVLVVPEDNLTWTDITFPKKGIYAMNNYLGYMSGMILNDYFGFGTETVNLKNGRKPVVPTIESSADGMVVKLRDAVVTLDAGVHDDALDIQLKQGDNEVAVTGSGTVEFKYQEGEL